MLENKEFFDLSNFPKKSKYHTDDNKKVPGKMKDEYGGTTILEYAGAKPKSYTLIDVIIMKKVHMKVIAIILKVVNLKM